MEPPGILARKADLRVLLFFVLAVLASFYLMDLRMSPRYDKVSATEYMLMAGTAERPYQYRVLVPWLVKWSSRALSVQPGKMFRAAEFLFAFLIFLSFRHYLSLFVKDRRASWLLSFAVFYALVFNYVLPNYYPGSGLYLPPWYPCDLPSVFFFTVGLALINKKRWVWYYPVFVLATFNRETTCFLTVVYLFSVFGKERPGRIAAHCAAQLVIWAGIKYFLYVDYIGNPGSALYLDTFSGNLDYLRHPLVYPYLISSMGFLWVPALIYLRKVDEEFLRRAMLVCVPFLTGMLFTGVIVELRIYGELIPVVLAPLLVALHNLAGSRRAAESALT